MAMILGTPGGGISKPRKEVDGNLAELIAALETIRRMMTTDVQPLQFVRMQPGEYRCNLTGCAYHIDRVGDEWRATFHVDSLALPGATSYRRRHDIGTFLKCADAKTAANTHEQERTKADDPEAGLAELRRLADEVFATAKKLPAAVAVKVLAPDIGFQLPADWE